MFRTAGWHGSEKNSVWEFGVGIDISVRKGMKQCASDTHELYSKKPFQPIGSRVVSQHASLKKSSASEQQASYLTLQRRKLHTMDSS